MKERFYGKKFLALRLIPDAEGPPTVGCSQLLIQYVRSYRRHW